MPNVQETPPAGAAHLEELFQREFAEHCSVASNSVRTLSSEFSKALFLMEQSLRHGGKLMLFGNGGSAADAQHIAAELVVRYKSNRRAIPAVALTTDTSALTACGNDFGFDSVFERQIEALAAPGDVVFAISTSGTSRNVIRGLRYARARGLSTVGLSGGSGGDMVSLCDSLLLVPSRVTARIQEMHITLGHIFCVALESRLQLA